jgi:hypothetical protein
VSSKSEHFRRLITTSQRIDNSKIPLIPSDSSATESAVFPLVQCQNYAAIFMFIENPGIVWHPETGQCVKTKLKIIPVSGVEPNGKEIKINMMKAKISEMYRACDPTHLFCLF